MRDAIFRERFAELYLAKNTSHVPIDVAAIWQDMTQGTTDIYILDRTLQDTQWVEKVECIRSYLPATHAMMLLFTWNGVGHYEVVTYNKVIAYHAIMMLCYILMSCIGIIWQRCTIRHKRGQ